MMIQLNLGRFWPIISSIQLKVIQRLSGQNLEKRPIAVLSSFWGKQMTTHMQLAKVVKLIKIFFFF